MNKQPTQLNLVHGWGLGREIWMPLLGYLGGWSEIRCLDLPGYAERDAMPADLSAWSDALAKDSAPGAIWVGSSLGGVVAAEIASRHPEKVAGLVTIGANPCFVERANWPHGMSAIDFESFVEEARENSEALLNRFMSLATSGSMTARDDLRQLRAIGSKSDLVSPAVLLAGLEILGDTDARKAWRTLKCPCLHIVPENDALVPASVLKFHQESPASQQTSLLGSAAHLPWLGRPRAVAELIGHWAASMTP